MIEIQNVVAKVGLNQRVDIGKTLLALTEPYTAYYRPAVFPGLVVKGEGVTFVIFSTGSIICVGAKSIYECMSASQRLYNTLLERGVIEDKLFEIDVHNIVAKAELGFKLDLERLADTLERVIYEPDIFPAAIHYMDRPRVTMLLFQSGRIVITGAKSEEEILEAYQIAAAKLSPMRLERAGAVTA